MDLGQILIIGGGIVALVVFIAILSFVPIGLWITAKTAGAGIAMMQLVAMRLRKVPPPLIVNSRINALKAGLNVTTNQLEAHYLARGHVDLVTVLQRYIPLCPRLSLNPQDSVPTPIVSPIAATDA